MVDGLNKADRLSRSERDLVKEIQSRLGERVAVELECILGKSIGTFYLTDQADERYIRQLAQTRGVVLPC